MKLTENFHISEFACKDGTQVPDELIDNVVTLADSLQALRDVLSTPIYINSAYRHEQYNASIGGSKSSQHIQATAADIRTEKHTPNDIYNTIESLIKEGKMTQGGLSEYSTFVHYDVRGYKARW